MARLPPLDAREYIIRTACTGRKDDAQFDRLIAESGVRERATEVSASLARLKPSRYVFVGRLKRSRSVFS